MPKSLSELTNNELARLILRQLWGFQDAGGVSMGRCLRSVLLEAAMDLLPLPKLHDPDSLTLFDLYKEAALPSRQAIAAGSEQIALPLLELTSDRDLAIMLLGRLWMWYENDVATHPQESLLSEQTILRRALDLLPTLDNTFTREDLIQEAREREHVRFEVESNKRDRGDWLRFQPIWALSH